MSLDLGFAFHKLELEAALIDAEKLWSTAIEVANEIIVLFDLNKNKAIKSKKFYELLHYDDTFPKDEDVLFSFLPAILSFAIALIILFSVEWRLTILLLIMSIVFILITLHYTKQLLKTQFVYIGNIENRWHYFRSSLAMFLL